MIGPDAARYLHLANGTRVPRPFCWRWLLPRLCGAHKARWWTVWAVSWPLLAIGILSLSRQLGLGWPTAFTATGLLLGLPGILGPDAVIPVGVDLPTTALAVTAAAGFVDGRPWPIAVALVLVTVAGMMKETAPIVTALFAWSPFALAGLIAPLARSLWVRWQHLEGPDPLGEPFQTIADHPFRTALQARKGQWRDARLMLAPWGVCLIGLHGLDWRLVAVLAVAHLQLAVATDTVRLVHHAAGPMLAIAAARTIPTDWLLLAVVAHFFWWFRTERV